MEWYPYLLYRIGDDQKIGQKCWKGTVDVVAVIDSLWLVDVLYALRSRPLTQGGPVAVEARGYGVSFLAAWHASKQQIKASNDVRASSI